MASGNRNQMALFLKLQNKSLNVDSLNQKNAQLEKVRNDLNDLTFYQRRLMNMRGDNPMMIFKHAVMSLERLVSSRLCHFYK